ncbi:hypothetical protein A4A49_64567, partial [Nicotiana attenuata]
NLMVGYSSAGCYIPSDLHNRDSSHHSSHPKPSLPSQNSHSQPEPCLAELWPSTVARNTHASSVCSEPANNANRPVELTHGANKTHPPFLPTSLPRGGDPRPSFSPWEPARTMTPSSMTRSENVNEHLEATNTELEKMIARLGVPK